MTLIPEALYSNEMVEEHQFRDLRIGEPRDVTNLEADWDGLAERVREIDPDGNRSYVLLLKIMVKK